MVLDITMPYLKYYQFKSTSKLPNELEFSFLKINMELFNVVIIQHVVFITNLQQNLFPTYGVVDLILKRPVK